MKSLVETVTHTLANWSGPAQLLALKSIILLAIVFVAMNFWRRGAAAVRHWVWTMAFVCLLALPIVALRLPVWSAPSWLIPFEANQSPASVEFNTRKLTPAAASTAFPVAAGPGNRQNEAQPTSSGDRSVVAWSGVVLAIWLGVMMLGFLRLLAVQVRLERLTWQTRACKNYEWLQLVEDLRTEYRIRRPVKLLISDRFSAPMTWGMGKPVVALPLESILWESARVQLVLRHELAHVKRWDCLTQEIAQLTCWVYWFNPLAWLAVRRMRAEREKACDDFVLHAGARPSEYAGHLVEIARQFAALPHLGGAVPMARPSGLEQRVLAILDGGRNRNRIAKATAAAIVLAVLGLELLVGGCGKRRDSFKDTNVDSQLKAFVSEKEAQAKAAVVTEGKEMLPEYEAMFAAASKKDWNSISNIWEDLRSRAPQYEGNGQKEDPRLHGTAWQTMLEIWGGFGNIIAGGEDRFVSIGRDVIESIPPGSIYFGGTDPGRCVITVLQKSHVNADPFFTLTQNALADGSYLQYLRGMYGKRIYIPTDEDSQKCFSDYSTDARKRLEEHKLKPGEDVRIGTNGTVKVSGQVAVMTINALLTKVIFDKNPDHECYIEESFPLDWMYPHLEPHGMIMRINRQPVTGLSEEIIKRDRDYWRSRAAGFIGNWLDVETPVKTVADYAEKTYAREDPKKFVATKYIQARSGNKWLSKLRLSIAGLYAWRAQHASNGSEKDRMIREADFAFRQAWAICPYSPEAVFRYVNLLLSQNRVSDALLIAETAAHMDEQNAPLQDLVKRLKEFQKNK